jgi:hypothetical protein
VRKALDNSQNSLSVWISSRNGTKGGIGQIISGIVTNIACDSLRTGGQFVALRSGLGFFVMGVDAMSFLVCVPMGLRVMATAKLNVYELVISACT